MTKIFKQLFPSTTNENGDDKNKDKGNVQERIKEYSIKLREIGLNKIDKDKTENKPNKDDEEDDDSEDEDEEEEDDEDGANDDESLKYTCFNSNISKAFNIFFFIETINEETDKYKEKCKSMSEDDRVAYEVFKDNSAHIEIDFKDNLHKVYFMIQPACQHLDQNKKNHFMDNVNRGTANEKITDLMAKTHEMFDVMDHMSKLKYRCRRFSIDQSI